MVGRKGAYMTPDEIRELMRLKGWSGMRLAINLDVTQNTVYRWLGGNHEASGPAAVLMRLWLNEAKEEATQENGKTKKARRETVPA